MAKGRSRRGSQTRSPSIRSRREASAFTSRRLPQETYDGLMSPAPGLRRRADVPVDYDRRAWAPGAVSAFRERLERAAYRTKAALRRAESIRRAASREPSVLSQNWHKGLLTAGIAVGGSVRTVPKFVVCARRAVRREVMHATGKAGIAGQRKPMFTKDSMVRC